MDYKVVLTLVGLIVSCYGALILFQRWMSKHIANSKKHPCTDDLIYKDTCEEIQDKHDMTEQTNKENHIRIEDCIEKAEERTEKRYAELKDDMNRGFDEVKVLIRG